jgi:hypothetical protein
LAGRDAAPPLEPCTLADHLAEANKTMQPASMIGLTIYEHGYFTRDQVGNDFISFF